MIAANHGGWYAYRLCPDGSDTEECFAQNYLPNMEGKFWMPVRPGPPSRLLRDRIQLPAGVECERCTLSVRWETWGGFPGANADGIKLRINCMDVRIRRKGGGQRDVEENEQEELQR